MRVALPLALILWLFSIPVAQAAYTVSTEEQAWAKCWDLKATKSGGYYNTADWSCKFNGNDAIILYNVNTFGTADTVRFSTACEYGRDETGCLPPPPPEPEECRELGEYYDSATQQCVTECAHGSLDHYCNQQPLEPDPEQPECGPDHPDYKGTIGYGGEATLICGDPDNQCPSGSTYGVIGKDGVSIGGCISNEYNPPKCSGTDVLKVDQWGGHSCLPLNKPGESNEPGSPDDPNNGDSDGDGQGDLTGIAKQMQDIKSLLGRGNTNTNNITESLKGMGKRLEDAIGNIPGGGGSSGSSQTEIVGEDGNSISWSGEPIDTELTDPTENYDQVMADYQAKINQIKGEVQAMFSTSLTGGGSVDDNIKSIHGVDVNFSLNRFLSGLDILGAIVLFCAAFISAGILFSGRG